jgi:hypothetical protein
MGSGGGDGDGDRVGGGDGAGAIADNGSGRGGGGGSVGLNRDVLLRYLCLRASVRMRQLGYVGSNFSVHLPPASPAVLFYFALPLRHDPMWHLVWYAVTSAALSWMHAECTKYRRFSPLPRMRGVNVGRLDLPPFLSPEEEGRWASGLGVNGGKTMERTDPAKMMAASLLNNKGGSAPLPRRGSRKGGSNATAIVAPRKVPLSGRTGAKLATNEINNNARGGVGGAVGGKLTTMIRCPAATVTTTQRGTSSNPSGWCRPCTRRGLRVTTCTQCNAPGSAACRRRTNSLRCANG